MFGVACLRAPVWNEPQVALMAPLGRGHVAWSSEMTCPNPVCHSYARPMTREDDILRHIAPDMSRQLLTIAGVYLVAYELVKSTVIDQVQGFYTFAWNKTSGPLVDESYREQVAGRSKHELDACLSWLVEQDALSDDEAASVHRLRDERNRIAHEVATLLVEPTFPLDLQPLIDARVVLKRLAVFFGGIEVDINPDYDRQDVDREGIESGVSVLYSHLLQAAFQETAATGPAGHEHADG
jgi:hypothetical protein